ncbi:MAG: HTTM domain-containing protein [Candidatus Hydrogenedentes bacterium]|nr:HTTM domain-containing protein [Candidatus Hydrogenedentota bacterium]
MSTILTGLHWQGIQAKLGAPVPIYSLIVLRVCLGLLAAWECLLLMASGSLTAMFVEPQVLFPYYGLTWVRPLPGSGIYLHFLVTLIAAAAMASGLFYRFSTAVFCVGWTWFWLLDQSYYQNHAYLISLLAGMLVFMPGNGALALDNLIAPRTRRRSAPAWTLYLLRAQLGIVYLYAAFAKFSPDWLQGEPMRGLVQNSLAGFPALGQPIVVEGLTYALSYGGLVFDLLVVPGLLWRPTRPYAFAAAVGFHLANSQLFHIDIFPWLAMSATTLYFAPDWPLRVAGKLGWVRAQTGAKHEPGAPHTPLSRRACVILAIYLAVQCLLPFRHLLYPGDHNWTEEGQQLSWFLMARSKSGQSIFLVHDPASGKKWKVDPQEYLHPRQAASVAKHPDMIWQFAQFIVKRMEQQGIPGVEVRAHVPCMLNNRKPALLVDPERNLAAEKRRLFSHYDWIMPHPGALKGGQDAGAAKLPVGETDLE